MILQFWQKHTNIRLLQQQMFQAVLFLSVFFLFFMSLGFYLYYAVIWSVICYLAIAVLFHLLNLPFFIFPNVAGPVYVPSHHDDIKVMLELAQVKKGDKAIDLGAGDGRLVIALAKAGAIAHGVEINPTMVRIAEASIAASGVKHATVEWQDFWEVNFADYDVVTVYGFPSIMAELEKKLQIELKPGARVVTNHYPFPNWKAARTRADMSLFVQK